MYRLSRLSASLAVRRVAATRSTLRRSLHSSSPLYDALVLAEHDNKSLNPATLHSITAAKELGPNVDVLVAGKDCSAAAEAAAKVEGVRKVFLYDDAALDHAIAERVSEAIIAEHKMGNYSHVVAAATSKSKNILPRLGAALDVQPLSDVQKILSEDTFVRPIYAGNVLQTVQSSDKVKVLTVRATAFAKANEGGDGAAVEKRSVPKAEGAATTFESEDLTSSERPELAGAARVVSVGRAIKSADNFNIIYDLADAVGAAVGASRAAVDAGYAPNDLQVGQTGKIVAPTLYMAVGISGAIQHLAGMKDSKVIVAINTDPDAPIFQVADYGLVEDLFKAVPALTEEIKKQKGK